MTDVRSILRRSVGTNADRVAVIADGQQLSFAEMWQRGLRLANGLRALGLRPQDMLATLEPNGLGALDTYMGAAAANLVRVPLYARNARSAHVQMLNNVGAKALIVDESHVEEVSGIAAEVPSLEHVLVRDAGYEDWLDAQAPDDPDPPVDDRDLYIVRHTGGTTGAPKAVPNTHRTWIALARDYFYPLPAPALGDRILHVGALSHASGYWLLPLWAVGGTQIVVNGQDAASLLEGLERQRIAYAFIPPVLLSRMVRVPGAELRDWSHAKALLMAGGPIGEDTIRRARSVFGDRPLHQLYGQTETGAIAVMGPQEWFADVPGANPLAACGRIHPWVDVEIRDDDGAALPLGEIGEVTVRCDGQFEGFYDAPKDSAARLVDGWVLTGDVGRVDDHGYLYLLDRKHDTIVSGGYNIYPQELENAISSHPAVLEVAVFGIPDEKWGETPMAVCCVAAGSEVAEEEIVSLVADRLGSYMKPSRVQLTSDPLPRSPLGKIMRKKLQDDHWDDHQRRIAGA